MFQFALVLKLNSENLIDPIFCTTIAQLFEWTSCKIFIPTKRMKFLITVHAGISFFFPPPFSFLSRSLRTILRAITRHFTDHLFTVRNITVRLDKIIFPSGLWVVRTNDLYCRKKKEYRKVYSSFSLWEKNKTILYVKWIVSIRCIDDALLPNFEKIIMELDNGLDNYFIFRSFLSLNCIKFRFCPDNDYFRDNFNVSLLLK